jgi:hypothetical protein
MTNWTTGTAAALSEMLLRYRAHAYGGNLLPSGIDAELGARVREEVPVLGPILATQGDAAHSGRVARGLRSMELLREEVHQHQLDTGLSCIIEKEFCFEPLGWTVTYSSGASYMLLIGDDGDRIQRSIRELAVAFADMAMGPANEIGWTLLQEVEEEEAATEDGQDGERIIRFRVAGAADVRREAGRATSGYLCHGAGLLITLPEDQAVTLHLHQGPYPGEDGGDYWHDETTTTQFVLVAPASLTKLLEWEWVENI